MLPAISPAVISHLAMPNSGVRRYAAALQSLVSAGARDRLARAEEPVVRRLCAGGGSHERTRLCLKFPVSRENTGNSSIRSSVARQRGPKRPSTQCLTSQFPTHPNREFFEALQGIKSDDQGNFFAHQGIRSRPLFWHLLCRQMRSSRQTSSSPRRRGGRRQMLEAAEADLALEAGFLSR